MKPEQALEKYTEGGRDKSFFRLAKITVAGQIGAALSSEAMRELIEFEEVGGHVALGFTRWVDFLEQSEFSPMSKNQYYPRKSVFEKEKADVWDRLSDMGVPISLRKRLPSGTFEVVNDAIVIKNGDGTTQSLPLDEANRTQIIETVKILHESILEKTKKLGQGEADYKRLKEKFLAAEESGTGHLSITELDRAHIVACGALSALAREIGGLSKQNCQEYMEGAFALLIVQYQQVNNHVCAVLELESLDNLDELMV